MLQKWIKQWWELVPLAADPSRLPKLPTEVWERILDECDDLDWRNEDKRASVFAACCLTSQALLPRSRYHLYKFVTVRSKEHIKQMSEMLNVIPALRTRVEVLIVFGSGDGKRDASWFGLVGFHLGSKLKALKEIKISNVDFSLMKLDAYKFWGAFNRSWQINAVQKLTFQQCMVTHVNQLIRLAFETKAKHLELGLHYPYAQNTSPLPAPVLSPGISLPLSYLRVELPTSDLMLSMPWHTLAKQCPSLTTVKISCRDESLDVSSPDHQTFLVSILCMFHRMQRYNNTNKVRLDIAPLPRIVMWGTPWNESIDADNASLSTRPRFRRELVLGYGWKSSSRDRCFKALTWLEDAMVLGNYTDRRFHQIEVCSDLGYLPPDSRQSFDGPLSRLLIVTQGRQVIIRGEGQFRKGCVVPWARKRFLMVTAMSPNAFCDPEAGDPCESHPKQASGVKQGQEGEESGWGWEEVRREGGRTQRFTSKVLRGGGRIARVLKNIFGHS